MTDPQDTVAVTQGDRRALSHVEQMLEAEGQCVPCKLCGGAAVITDAGPGAGYYVACSNSQTRRSYQGCLINERRVSGWAYNVADWWNRLHRLEATQQAGWQGIETVRGEVKACLLWCADLNRTGKPRGICMGRISQWSDGTLTAYGNGMNGDWTFTHWQPLPAAPSATRPAWVAAS